jgi:hypothetical protein
MTAGRRDDARFSRRRFLTQGLGGITVMGLGAWGGSGPRRADPEIRIDVHSRVFNGQDLHLARFLEGVVAPGHPDHAALIHAGANVAQALAWALAPSGAAETRRLDELARRGWPGLAASDDREMLGDRAEADRRFLEALRVMLPGTGFFRLYLDCLSSGARASLGRATAARLARMAGASILGRDEVAFLLSPEGPEHALLPIRPLHAFRRYTYYRYLSVWDLFDAMDGGPGGVDLVVPTVAAFDGRSCPRATPTPPDDQLLAMARLVPLCGGRLHPLVPFDPCGQKDGRDSLARVRDAVERRGFVGVTLSSPCARASAGADRGLHALLAWCAREEVAVVAAGAPVGAVREGRGLGPEPEAWSRLVELHPGLRLGVRRDRLEGAPPPGAGLMYGIDWIRRSIEGGVRDVLGRDGPVLHHLDDAAAFLGLRRGRRARERLERFYDRHRMTAPGWMSALDASGPGIPGPARSTG